MSAPYRARKRAFSLIFIWILAISFAIMAGTAVFGMEPFQIKTYVTDQAGLLSGDEQAQLATELDDYAKATGNQLLVVTTQSLQGEDLVDYTEKLFALNKPGQKGKDNGLILFIALKEKKIRIEVGYGLEASVPDGKVGAIIDEQIAPYFKEGNYSSGIKNGVYTLIKSITPEYKLDNLGNNGASGESRAHSGSSSLFWIIVIIIIVIFGSISNNGNNIRRRHRRGFSEPWFWGGGFGGGGGSSGGIFGGGGSGGGFSGGGGSFGGGGASGGW